jgi:hypothetical protein
MSIYAWAKPISSRSVITPDEFITWAEQDIKGGGKRERANALTNAKRALHGRIDEILYSVRVRYANDWPKWRQIVDTSRKLKVLKRLNIKITAIVGVLTERRNDLEHSYLLPPLDQVRADVETAEMWLETSKSYLHPPVVLAGLSIKSRDQSVYIRTRKNTLSITFHPTEKILFFCDAERKLFILKPDGTQCEMSYDNLGWKDMIRYQQPYLSDDNQLIVSTMSIVTKIYSKYKEWVREMRKVMIKSDFTVLLKEDDVLRGKS